MAKVTGIGCVVLFANNAEALAQWYQTHLGIAFTRPAGKPYWSARVEDPASGTSFMLGINPSLVPLEAGHRSVLINCRVENLPQVLEHLRTSGIPIQRVRRTSAGTFVYLQDPEGHVLELCSSAPATRRARPTRGLN